MNYKALRIQEKFKDNDESLKKYKFSVEKSKFQGRIGISITIILRLRKISYTKRRVTEFSHITQKGKGAAMLLLKDCHHYVNQDFKILAVIGSGGTASVHAAYWKDDATKFAIKKITKSVMEEEIIINEINIMKRVDFHPNIIKFVGVIIDEINYSLVLEYADGGTLGKYLEIAETLTPEIQLKFAKEIASAIYCLHNYDIIHRDIVSLNYRILR
uniref:non-specific serine/threonine protein kinase n=1 Tax=Rhizophagus irregularis (strain DAOM 181602 / DAOM 197198 / MUCL 43194) TaxID=747089 RepID=U9TYG5_RHIID